MADVRRRRSADRRGRAVGGLPAGPPRRRRAARHRRRRHLRAVGHLRVGGRRHRPAGAAGRGRPGRASASGSPRSCRGRTSRRTGTSSRSPTRWGRSTRSGATSRTTPNSCTPDRGRRGPGAAARVHRHGAVPGRLPPALPDPVRASCPKAAGGSRSTATASATSRAPTRSGCRPSASTTTSTWAPPTGPGPTATTGSSRGLEVLIGPRARGRVRWWPTTRSSAAPAGCWPPTSGPRS